jgi:hypothetical protein
MKRADLDAYATDRGIGDAAKMKNRAEVIAAIRARADGQGDGGQTVPLRRRAVPASFALPSDHEAGAVIPREGADDAMSEANEKPNRGQDEQTHTFVNDDGEERVETMRWFRAEGRAAGFRKPDDAEGETDAAVEDNG